MSSAASHRVERVSVGQEDGWFWYAYYCISLRTEVWTVLIGLILFYTYNGKNQATEYFHVLSNSFSSLVTTPCFMESFWIRYRFRLQRLTDNDRIIICFLQIAFHIEIVYRYNGYASCSGMFCFLLRFIPGISLSWLGTRLAAIPVAATVFLVILVHWFR